MGKKEKHPFLHQEESEPEDENIPVPEELQCLICRDLLVDSVVIPCCGNSYCDDCEYGGGAHTLNLTLLVEL